jgi:TonB family protein
MHQASFTFDPERPRRPDAAGSQRAPAPIRAPRLLVTWTPFWPSFLSNVADVIGRRGPTQVRSTSAPGIFWPDVFVVRPLPWKELGGSAVFHVALIAFVVSTAGWWFGGERVRLQDPVRHTAITYYQIEEFLPELKSPEPPQRAKAASKGDPESARQRIISTPPVADNSVQTIVNPMFPQKLLAAEPMPNLVIAAPAVLRPKLEVPVDLPFVLPQRIKPAHVEARQLAKLPDLSPPEAIAPPTAAAVRNLPALELPPVEPIEAPKLALSAAAARKLELPQVEAVAAPATASSQPVLARKLDLPAVETVAPPVHGANGAGPNREALGQIVALNLRPSAPQPELKIPAGSRSGVFAATPEGRVGAAGTPEVKATARSEAADSPVPGLAAGTPSSGISVTGGSAPKANGVVVAGVPRPDSNVLAMKKPSPLDVARLPDHPVPPASAPGRVQDDSVFGDRRVYAMYINLPNLTSAGGSWIIRFAERDVIPRAGDLATPVALNKVDPAYPPDLIRDKVEGVVTLYAVIKEDGTVSDIRVLHGFNDRLNENARIALSRWHFRPATKNGVPVELEAVVQIPFRIRRTGF